MAAICPSFLRGQVLRVTRLDSCGRPVAGACGYVVSDGFVSVTMSTEVDEGTEINVPKANGQLCVIEAPCPQIKWYTVEIAFCQVDVDLITIVNPTWRRITDEAGDPIGWYESTTLDCSTGWALEVWTNVANAESVCDNPNATGAWGYIVLKWLTGGVVGDLTIENDAVTFTYTGQTKRGGAWGVGPYNIRLNPTNATPLPLPAVLAADEHRAFLITTMAPPEPVCGCQTLTPITPPTPVVTAVEYTPDATGNTATITWTNYGAGAGTLDVDDGAQPNISVADTGSMQYTFVNAGPHVVTFTDADQPARTDSAPSITTPFP